MVNKREQKEEEKKTEKATVNEPEIKEKSILLKRFIVERTKNNKNTRKSLWKTPDLPNPSKKKKK